jgi:hypothetical protein
MGELIEHTDGFQVDAQAEHDVLRRGLRPSSLGVVG